MTGVLGWVGTGKGRSGCRSTTGARFGRGVNSGFGGGGSVSTWAAGGGAGCSTTAGGGGGGIGADTGGADGDAGAGGGANTTSTAFERSSLGLDGMTTGSKSNNPISAT